MAGHPLSCLLRPASIAVIGASRDPAKWGCKVLRNIVGNLLSNAFKYSPRGGTVTFAARKKKGEIVLTVSDQGIGIPQADQALLFQTFHRASNVGAIAGTGLGLSIVKEAVDCHQGRIEVQSTEGEGSQFTVMLPASTVTA